MRLLGKRKPRRTKDISMRVVGCPYGEWARGQVRTWAFAFAGRYWIPASAGEWQNGFHVCRCVCDAALARPQAKP